VILAEPLQIAHRRLYRDLPDLLSRLEFRCDSGRRDPSVGFDLTVGKLIIAKADRQRIYFIGNGGSAGIASHMAADFLKAGGFAAMTFNDAPLITCLANDLGYQNVFHHPLTLHGRTGDMLFAISSSGESASIVNAAEYAKSIGMTVVTLSGFKPDNRLRQIGDLNFYVPSDRYGLVEVAHHAILHAILDQVVDAAAGR
jgi:D-sedoheptulose 7-phosphate isomerase